ncbi:Zinc metalloprotease [Xenorhabdus nematophila ATCC 19061]|uniref:Zinc metalloprotease n=1 Tax=Xenorhabdus nematophila (strain ATCC 19061 / DSM 3370 / CCUG 14189 / LMG 1036 / NCIMB 9965 / AN6) TaxID=406817 RepID=D3VG20_XENNA|nr:SprT family zinc-dependent metalloprotease [Xenorhabdus nematophila]CBJ88110.1 Zinc metalloprotease [Xenorhabdus nematophila ATCC 19061]CEK21022.1 Zinc metalloprotease [Xenorhabdus nematophila AN6/1]
MAQLKIGEIDMQLNRKAIKNLHISVLPPDGIVRISAPMHMSDTAIRMAVISRIPWIKKQQQDFARQPRQSEREMVNGECHYLWGRRHRLNIVEHVGKQQVKTSGGKIYLYVPYGAPFEKKAQVLSDYYRAALKERIEKLLMHWQPIIGVMPSSWGIKKMKTKWGSCNTVSGSIWLNLELAKKPLECLEFILVHELVHLLERKHNERFMTYMDGYLPDWRERKRLLSILPLSNDVLVQTRSDTSV